MAFRAAPELAATIRRLADERGVSLSRIIRDALALAYGEGLDAETRATMQAITARMNARYNTHPRRPLSAPASAVPGAEQPQPNATEGQAPHFAMAS